MLTAERKRTKPTRRERQRAINANKLFINNTSRKFNKNRDRKFRGWMPNKSKLPSLGMKSILPWAEFYYYLNVNPFKSDDIAFIVLNDLLETNPSVFKNGLKQNLGVHETIIWMLNHSVERWIELIKGEFNIELFQQPVISLTRINDKYSIKFGTNYQPASPLGLPLIKRGSENIMREEEEILKTVSSVFGVSSCHRAIEIELESLEENAEEYFLDERDINGLEEYKSVIMDIAGDLDNIILAPSLGYEAFNKNSPKELVRIYQKLKELESIESKYVEIHDLEPYFGSHICDETIFFYKAEDDEILQLIANEFDSMFQTDLFIPPMLFEPVEVAEKTFPLRNEIFEKLAQYYYGT